jgi:hypothetical protein
MGISRGVLNRFKEGETKGFRSSVFMIEGSHCALALSMEKLRNLFTYLTLNSTINQYSSQRVEVLLNDFNHSG